MQKVRVITFGATRYVDYPLGSIPEGCGRGCSPCSKKGSHSLGRIRKMYVSVCACVCVCASRRTRVRIPSHHCTHLKGDMVRFEFASTCAVVVMQKGRGVAFECLAVSDA